MYRLIPLIVFSVSFINCSSTNDRNEKRVKLIKTAIGFIERGSIDSLNTIVDTSHIYDLYSKEGFEGRMFRAQEKIGICDIPNPDKYKISHPVYQTTEYTLQFCRSKNDSIAADSFDLVFTFFDYKNNGLIEVLDMRNYTMPTEAAEPPPGL